MSISGNFGNPKGLLGRLMLSGMNMGHTPMAKWGFTQFTVPKDGKIADIGCGGGYNVRRLLERSGNGFVYGVDHSEASVEKSRAANKKDLGKRCKIVQASAEQLPFKDNTFDLVTAFETVYFWPNIESCFKEIRRVLKDNGQFAVINDPGDPEKHWEEKIPGMTAYTADEIACLMEQAGFADDRITTNKYMYCVIGKAIRVN